MAEMAHESTLGAIGRNIFERRLVKIRDIAYKCLWTLAALVHREHHNARVPSLNPTKGPFRAFRALRLAENERRTAPLPIALFLSSGERPEEFTRRHRYLSALCGRILKYILNNAIVEIYIRSFARVRVRECNEKRESRMDHLWLPSGRNIYARRNIYTYNFT